jgi:hypothetical protein
MRFRPGSSWNGTETREGKRTWDLGRVEIGRPAPLLVFLGLPAMRSDSGDSRVGCPIRNRDLAVKTTRSRLGSAAVEHPVATDSEGPTTVPSKASEA